MAVFMKRYRFQIVVRMGAMVLTLVSCDLCFSAVPDERVSVGSTPTNALTLEALVAETLVNNRELSFYKAEITAAKGERQTAQAWANPELAGTAGSKRSVAPGASGEGVAWSVTVRQTFEWPG